MLATTVEAVRFALSHMTGETCSVLAGVIPLFLLAFVADNISLQQSGVSPGDRAMGWIRKVRWWLLPILFAGLELAFALGIAEGYEGRTALALWALFTVLLLATLAGWFVTLTESSRRRAPIRKPGWDPAAGRSTPRR